MTEMFPTEPGYAIRFRRDRYEPSPGADLTPAAALRAILAGHQVQACAVHTTEDRPERYAGDCLPGLVVFLQADDEQEDSAAPQITAHWSGAELDPVTGSLMTVMTDLIGAARFLADLAGAQALIAADPSYELAGPATDADRELAALYAMAGRLEQRVSTLRETVFARDGIS